ncbi:MAG: NYN domain-containing protein [Pseudonocardiaceae bacterium]|nr:NYN domain-containing protein [Pseudonocardiaceae bacterium]
MQPPARVVVFVDYQNTHLGALRAFWPSSALPASGHINPRALGDLLVSKRMANCLPSELVQVRVYRGRPEPTRQPGPAAANDRQADAWSRLGKVQAIRRPLRYPRKWPVESAHEKGVDVALAVDMVRLAIEGAYDVGVVVSADTDLLPALEAVNELGAAHVEVAGWWRQPRLRLRRQPERLWCHWLNEQDYRRVEDLTNYAAPGSSRPDG